MSHPVILQAVCTEIGKGIRLSKCQQCGCMREVLDYFAESLPAIGTDEARALLRSVQAWNAQMKPVQYACLGCTVCFPAVAQNAFAAVLPAAEPSHGLSCDFRMTDDWPAVVGEYFVVDKTAHVAVSTLGSVALASDLAHSRPKGLAIVGKTETENIGIDKIVKNVITNPALQYLIVTGRESAGHQSGNTLLALSANGTDQNGRVIGSAGKRPALRNVSRTEVEAFRAQVEVIDLTGCESVDAIQARVEALSPKAPGPCG
jgi:tetrahydromethanopterin S-methyltransferase subunit A